MAAKGYQNYHGKKNSRRTALVVLLAAVLMLCAGYLLIQNYIIYNADGSITVDLPFLREEESADRQSGAQPPLEIVRPQHNAPEAGAPAGNETAFSVSEETLYALWEGEVSGPAPGCQGLVMEVKGESGTFYYQSDRAAEGAVDSRALSPSSVRQMLGEEREWSAVAAVCCLRDDIYAMADMVGAGVCQSTGYIWFGVDNAHYLDPAKAGARDYLCAVAEECRDMGFDEVLLRDFAYPTRGKLEKIDDSSRGMSREEALEGFLRQLRERVGEEMLVSVEISAQDVLAGHNSLSGVELSRLVPLVDRLYVTGPAERAALEEALAPLLEGEVPAGLLVLEAQQASA